MTHLLIPIKDLEDVKINIDPSVDSLLKLQKIINSAKQISLNEEQLKELLNNLVNDCMASDFNEHRDSYIKAKALQSKK